MDEANLKLASQLISRTYVDQGGDALRTRRKLIKTLLSQRRLPAEGWDEETVELFIKVPTCASVSHRNDCYIALEELTDCLKTA